MAVFTGEDLHLGEEEKLEAESINTVGQMLAMNVLKTQSLKPQQKKSLRL